jgi:diguanylate cyclase (GGDEF)-like protein
VADKPIEDEDERATTAEIDQATLEARLETIQARRAMLVILSGANVGTIVPLDVPEIVFGRDPGCDVRLTDEGVSRRHARALLLPDGACAVEDLGSTNGTSVNGEPIDGRRELQDGDRILIGHTVLKFLKQSEVDAEFQSRVYEVSVRDGLTRVYNRKYFEDRLSAEVAYARRHRSLLALLMLDIDHFKQVNDTHGHLIGDRVLMEVATLVRAQVRSEDVLARYGGEEFVVLVREIMPPGVMVLAERIRKAVEAMRVGILDGQIAVTVSVGAITMRGAASMSPQGLVAAADRLMYRAKSLGRNRTCAEAQV